MLEKLFVLLLGKKASTTLAGLAAGALTGAAAVAMQGQLNKEALITGGIAGAASALAGITGRGQGENT